MLFAGQNPVALDASQAWLMGFDYRCIPSIVHGLSSRGYTLLGAEYSAIELVGAAPRCGRLGERILGIHWASGLISVGPAM